MDNQSMILYVCEKCGYYQYSEDSYEYDTNIEVKDNEAIFHRDRPSKVLRKHKCGVLIPMLFRSIDEYLNFLQDNYRRNGARTHERQK